jgi:aminomethyltransferase
MLHRISSLNSARLVSRLFATSSAPPKHTPLYDWHVKHGGALTDFSGWMLPQQYKGMGSLESSIHTRKQGCFSVFDVSHMLQLTVKGPKSNEFFEACTVVDCKELGNGSVKLSLITNNNGGIIDDCMVARKSENEFRLVVNAGCADKDLKHLQAMAMKPEFKGGVDVIPIYDRALVAAQGPAAAAAVEKLSGQSLSKVPFMHMVQGRIAGADVIMTRCGYTGEDGFEISIPQSSASAVADALLQCSGAAPAGLTARDILRLESGLCLYGSDIDMDTSPVKAALMWTISKRRRQTGGFPGSDIIMKEFAAKPSRIRSGLVFDGKRPARHGAKVLDASGAEVGVVTSGSFSPNLNKCAPSSLLLCFFYCLCVVFAARPSLIRTRFQMRGHGIHEQQPQI